MAQLIACVQEAKKTNDEFLTNVIQEEKRKSHTGEVSNQESKKAKMDDSVH